MQPLVAPPGQSVTVYAVVCSGSRGEVETALREAAENKPRFPEMAEESRRRSFRAESTEAGAPYRFSRERLAAVTLTNVVFPTWFKGQNVRHHAPGRRWNCLYTWDSGFIGLGLLELGTRLAVENLNAYLTGPEVTNARSSITAPRFRCSSICSRSCEPDRRPELAKYFYPETSV